MKLEFEDYKRIQKMKEAGYNASQTIMRLGYTLYSVYKVWNMSEEEFLSIKPTQCVSLEKYREFVVELLKKYPLITSSQVLDRIREYFNEDLEVSLPTFYRFMKLLRKKEGFVQTNQTRQFKRISTTEPGEEGQVDLGQMSMKDINGKQTKVYFFCMVLSYSRMKYVYLSAVPFDSLRFCYAHDRAFRYFGGRPRQIMYDQDRVQVVSENAGDIIFTKEYENYRQKTGIDVYLCKPSDPDTKGKVENVVRYVKMNFLANREYNGIDSLNVECLKWLDRTGNNTPHATTYKKPTQMFEIESKYLLSYEAQNIDLIKKRIVTVSGLNTILFKRNRYSITQGKYYEGDRLLLTQEDDMITLTDPTTGEVVAVHNVADAVGEIVPLKSATKAKPKIFKDVLAKYKDKKYAVEFLNNLAELHPRYIREQMLMLSRCQKSYDEKSILKAIRFANSDKMYSMNDVVSILIMNNGIASAKKVMPHNTSKRYEEKAENISKSSRAVSQKKKTTKPKVEQVKENIEVESVKTVAAEEKTEPKNKYDMLFEGE